MDVETLRRRIDDALNDRLVEMREGHDDSVVGFNEAWDVVRSVLEREKKRESDEQGASG